MSDIHIITDKISRDELKKIAEERFDDMVKAVIDIERGIMAIGGELHADEEALLLEQGSRQANLWGINIYPDQPREGWIEFDSMVNIRPRQGNRSRHVDDPKVCERIMAIVNSLVA